MGSSHAHRQPPHIVVVAVALLLRHGAVHAGECQDFTAPLLPPVPDSVAGAGTTVVPLDGRWDFDDGSNSHSAQIDVPGEWEMQGFHVNAGAPARYRRIFTLPAGWERLRTWIRFDGVSSWCSIAVNGRAVGTHDGSFVPFAFDITPAVRPGTNTLDVDVRWGTISDTLACTSQYAAHPVGGILRRVRLYALPDTHIQEFTYETSLDSGLTSALLTLRTVVTSQGGRRSAALISWSLVDERDSVVARVSRPITPAGRGRQTVNDTCLLQIAHPLAWDPEHPHLYVLRGSLTVDGTMCQTIRSRVGLRQIAIRENRLFVNGRPIKLHGVNHHDIYPLTGRSVTAELCRRDVELFREANCNYIRTSHYPPPEALLEACDELGMFVESEASLCWIAHEAAPAWTGRDYRDPALLPYLVRANVENVLAGRGHPSVIIWSLGNESKWSPLWERVNAEVKRLDPSRPTSFHDQSWGKYNNEGSRADIANYHYPGPDGPARCDRTTDRPTLFGEYMHVQTYARRENEADPGVRGDTYARALAAMVDSVYAHDGALGGAIWAGVDDLFHLSTEKICGYGTWGLIDGWRRPKPEYTAARNAYSPVVFRDLPTALPLSGRVVLHVENRFNFTNLTECAISARAGEKVVELHADVAPHSNGTIEFDASALGGQSPVLIHVRDARGFVCAEESLTAGPHPRVRTGAPVKVSLTTFPHSFKIHSGSAEFLVDRRDGSMRYILAGGDTVARDCARWMLVRHNADDGGAPGTSGNNYTQDIVPLADTPCTGFVPSSVTETREDDGSIRVDVHGVYGRVLEGNLAMRFPPAGGVQLSYDYTVLSGFTKSAGTLLRQYGLLFTLPPSMDRLSWTRKGLWTVYPPTDPGRLQGTAKAHPRRGGFIQVPRLVPSGDWKDDAIPLGTNDFRGTKEGILSASLDDGTHAVTVASDGTQSTRTWVGNGAVMLFVAGFNGPGSCPFTMGPRPEFPAGAHITGAFTLSVQ
ncbi:MAG TPA: glycoside hydrolase family 2 TIM barrel-domain containing protein [Bacteroidota bacterium]|nr:glycoside hydrolase family 2 TIM barrel-domain containing protein [Bacteroidota bacterium]